MPLNFTKMHGLGNDYIYVNLFTERVADPPALARAISDRHRGVGSDGLILIAPPTTPDPRGGVVRDADARMIMFNADGSRSQMCGNGIRCVAKYVYERGISRRNPLRIATDAGLLKLELRLDPRGSVAEVRVDMGEPILDAQRIPVHVDGAGRSGPGAGSGGILGAVVDLPIESGGRTFLATCVSMGNPHAVMFCDDLATVRLHEWGPRLEHHPAFPERVNAHWVQVERPDRVCMVTWERGSGVTQACGTGAAAVCVAGVLKGLTTRRITARLPGGELVLEWNADTNHVCMTGPATHVCDGVWPDEPGA
jgi:diaminopimelate epimerase